MSHACIIARKSSEAVLTVFQCLFSFSPFARIVYLCNAHVDIWQTARRSVKPNPRRDSYMHTRLHARALGSARVYLCKAHVYTWQTVNRNSSTERASSYAHICRVFQEQVVIRQFYIDSNSEVKSLFSIELFSNYFFTNEECIDSDDKKSKEKKDESATIFKEFNYFLVKNLNI